MRSLVAAVMSSLLRVIRRRHFPLCFDEWREVRLSFSQLGEDRIVWHILREHRNNRGIYVDVGAFDPIRYSNTLILHKEGWRGVNIDPNPETMIRFAASRPLDSNICAAVSNSERRVDYLVYAGAATNRIVEPTAEDVKSVLGEAPLRRIAMTTRRLSDILVEATVEEQRIDFLNVDCEGEDLNVLESLDWDRWRPRVVCVEAHGAGNRDAVMKFMVEKNYALVAQMLVSFIFQSNE
ncbi:MAG: FkbM family methyltransferase [Burkholderiales bacterium]